ncbi:MAG: preprotein translocase subunit YajC [Pseudomonadota bacterium]
MRQFLFLALSALVMSPVAAAQEASGPAGGILGQLLFFVPLILIFYFLLIRPANQRQKRHKEMVEGVKKGDTIVTAGGLIGKVTKVAETEVTVELADGVRVRTVRAMIADVRDKGAPVPANDTAQA